MARSPGRLQHQRGRHISQSIDWKQDPQDSRLCLGGLRVCRWKLQSNKANLGLAGRNLGNSWLALSDFNRRRSASRFQPRGVFRAELRALVAPKRLTKLQTVERYDRWGPRAKCLP